MEKNTVQALQKFTAVRSIVTRDAFAVKVRGGVDVVALTSHTPRFRRACAVLCNTRTPYTAGPPRMRCTLLQSHTTHHCSASHALYSTTRTDHTLRFCGTRAVLSNKLMTYTIHVYSFTNLYKCFYNEKVYVLFTKKSHEYCSITISKPVKTKVARLTPRRVSPRSTIQYISTVLLASL